MSRKKLNSKLNELLDKEQITALEQFKHQLEMKERRQKRFKNRKNRRKDR